MNYPSKYYVDKKKIKKKAINEHKPNPSGKNTDAIKNSNGPAFTTLESLRNFILIITIIKTIKKICLNLYFSKILYMISK